MKCSRSSVISTTKLLVHYSVGRPRESLRRWRSVQNARWMMSEIRTSHYHYFHPYTMLVNRDSWKNVCFHAKLCPQPEASSIFYCKPIADKAVSFTTNTCTVTQNKQSRCARSTILPVCSFGQIISHDPVTWFLSQILWAEQWGIFCGTLRPLSWSTCGGQGDILTKTSSLIPAWMDAKTWDSTDCPMNIWLTLLCPHIVIMQERHEAKTVRQLKVFVNRLPHLQSMRQAVSTRKWYKGPIVQHSFFTCFHYAWTVESLSLITPAGLCCSRSLLIQTFSSVWTAAVVGETSVPSWFWSIWV